MRGNETLGRIVTNIRTCVKVHDVMTCADVHDYRLRGLGGGHILGFSIYLRSRNYTIARVGDEKYVLRVLVARHSSR